METTIPSWLDKSFLEAALQNEGIKVLKFSVKPAVGEGENYCSHLYKVKVNSEISRPPEGQSISLMVKASISDGILVDVLGNTETKVYTDILPILNSKLNCDFGPKLFYSPRENVLVLEDLDAEGFSTCNRFEQLDFSHCKVAIERLAKYHASTIAFHRENPKLVEEIGVEKGYSDGNSFSTGVQLMLKVCMNQFVNRIKTMDIDRRTLDFISNREKGLWNSVVNLHKPSLNRFNVLNHGDFWTNNIMFKHDESGYVVDVKFIDFQFPKYASPLLDVIYFLWGSGSDEVRENRLDDLYNVYLKTFNQSLGTLGCEDRLFVDEFYADLHSHIDMVLVSLSFDQLFFSCKPEDTYSFENLTEEDMEKIDDDEQFLKLINGEHYCKMLPAAVKQFEKCFWSQF